MLTDTLGERDFEILKYLAVHPTSSMAEVAQNLHYRGETVSSHIHSMQERGIYITTMALLSYRKLNMAYVPVLITAPLANLPTIYEKCRAHPYIQYSVRTLGATDGAFLVFNPPQRAVPLLVQFLDELAAQGVVTDYRVFVNEDTKRDFLKADLNLYNRETGVWEFNWNKWQAPNEAAETAANGGQAQSLVVQPELNVLDKSDMKLLGLLTADAKAPTEELAKATNLAPHTVRRRIQNLEDNGFIIGYRAMIAFSKFHLSSSMLFNCNAPPLEVEKCKRKLLTIPFPGTFIPVQNGFLCQATLPPEGLPAVHQFLSRHCNNVSVSWFDLPTSDVALLNTDAFDGNDWRVDPSFLINEPLGTSNKKHVKN